MNFVVLGKSKETRNEFSYDFGFSITISYDISLKSVGHLNYWYSYLFETTALAQVTNI